MSETARTLPSGAIIDDRRSEADKANTAYLVVATDKFMSGWGQAPARSIFAVPCSSQDQAFIVADNMRRRSEMKRVRIVWASPFRPRLYRGDHLSIRNMSECSRFYEPNGFQNPRAARERNGEART